MKTIISVLWLGVFVPSCWAQIPAGWTWMNPLPQGNQLNAVASGNGLAVAVGEAGTILASSDATNWNIVTAPANTSLHAVCHGGSTFVAAGTNGIILTSTNGTDWTQRDSTTTNTLRSVTIGNGLFVVAGDRGTILVSSDSSTWTAATSGVSNRISSVAFGNNKFIAVCNNAALLTSTNALSWTPTTTGGPATNLNSIAFGNGYFVALGLGAGKSPCAARSADGVTWTNTMTGPGGDAITFGSTGFIAARGTNAFISTNGLDWTTRSMGIDTQLSFNYGSLLKGIVEHGSSFISVGELGYILTSFDGIDWSSQRIHLPQYTIAGFAEGGGLLVLPCGNNALHSTGGVLLSSNSGAFTIAAPVDSSPGLSSITYGNGTFVTVGSGGLIRTSQDGINWTNRNSGTSTRLHDIVFGNGFFVAVGDTVAGQPPILTSSNARAWTGRFAGVSFSLYSIAYGNGTFVTVGENGTILTSTDLATWFGQDSTTGLNLSAVEYGNGMFVAVGQNGIIITSTDAINWQNRSAHPISMRSLAFGNGAWLCLNDGGLILSSLDGISWVEQPFRTQRQLSCVAFAQGHFWLGGEFGTILRSEELPALRITNQRISENHFTFTFEASSQHTYKIYAGPAGNWLHLSTVSNTQGVVEVVDPAYTTHASRLYKVEVQGPRYK